MAKQHNPVINEYHLNRYEPGKPQFALHDLKEYLKANRCDAIQPHIHSFYQVIWFQKGKGTHSVDFKGYEVSENVIFFIAQNQVHHFDEGSGYEGFLLHFNEAFLVENENEMDFFLKSNLFNSINREPSCRIGGEVTRILNTYISLIREELKNNEDFGQELIIRNYLKSFLIQIQRKKNETDQPVHRGSPVPDEKRRQLITFSDLVDQHFRKGYSIAEYAGLLHMSPRSLSDLTQQQLNKTPSQMLQERIILEAQRLLLYSGLNVSQIGYRLGFDDASYFVKYFKKHTKISPSEFRKSVS